MIHNMTGGAGGSVKHFAAISVTYPKGAKCSCTNGSKLFEAADTSGIWMFSVPEAGSWTVTVTDGSRTKSQTVQISTSGQHESIMLTLTLVLFDNGEYAAETGGFSSITEAGRLKASAGTSSQSGANSSVYSKALMDLSNYSTLHFQVTASSTSHNGSRVIGVAAEAAGGSGFLASVTSPEVGEVTIDISSITDKVAIRLYAQCWHPTGSAYVTSEVEVSKIWVD